MYLGIDPNSGLAYEGLGAPDFPSIPSPHIVQAKLIESESDWTELPTGIATTPFAWVFREDSFDAVTRTRRGRLYESPAGQVQPADHSVSPHPYEDPSMRNATRGRVSKPLFTYWACNSLLLKPNRGQGLTLALGSDRAPSGWRIIQTEVLANRCVLVTLKSLSAFAILPEVDYTRIDEPSRPAVGEALQRVLDSAFRESAISVVDHCRAALTVLLSRWLLQNGYDESVLDADLGDLAKKVDGPMGCASRVSQVVARLHSRGKPGEQHSKRLRQPVEGDDEFALHAVGLVLRDFGWSA